MLVALAHALRCPRDHRESWMVLGTDTIQGANVVEGVLGCPVCRARYPVHEGGVDLRLHPGPPSDAPAASASAEPGARGVLPGTALRASPGSADAAAGTEADAEQGVRLAAFLNLVEAGGYALLVGAWARHAAALRQVADVHVLMVNPAAGAISDEGRTVLRVDARLPLAAASLRGVALDSAAAPELVAGAVRALRRRGRMLGPLSLPVPEGIAELDRDQDVWVGERTIVAVRPVSLQRRTP
jgi:hypothetical protein